MKTYVGDDYIIKAQELIDSLPDDAVISLAYNEDTSKLDFSGKKVIEVCDAGNLISSRFPFDVTIDKYDEQIVDLCVLGIGYKGQIGFNEVATPFDSYTHEQKLTESTREEYSFLGELPDSGLTMGIKSICSSREIIVLASGEKRADAVFGMLYGRDDSTVPAAFLQIPPNVYVFADYSAASKL